MMCNVGCLYVGEVEHQKRLTDVAMADLAVTTTDTGDSGSNLVHQVAQFRGATQPQTRDPAPRSGRLTAADEGTI